MNFLKDKIYLQIGQVDLPALPLLQFRGVDLAGLPLSEDHVQRRFQGGAQVVVADELHRFVDALRDERVAPEDCVGVAEVGGKGFVNKNCS